MALFLMVACDRDDELALRSRLDQWFFLGSTLYFESRVRCTGAIIHVTTDRTRPALAVQGDPDSAKNALRAQGVAAIRVDGMTPADLTDAMLLSGAGTFGRQALAAGALAGPCFKEKRFSAFLHDALTRPGATMAYDSANEGLMILDPDRNSLFYVAGDVF
jgi:hypothetical protein